MLFLSRWSRHYVGIEPQQTVKVQVIIYAASWTDLTTCESTALSTPQRVAKYTQEFHRVLRLNMARRPTTEVLRSEVLLLARVGCRAADRCEDSHRHYS